MTEHLDHVWIWESSTFRRYGSSNRCTIDIKSCLAIGNVWKEDELYCVEHVAITQTISFLVVMVRHGHAAA